MNKKYFFFQSVTEKNRKNCTFQKTYWSKIKISLRAKFMIFRALYKASTYKTFSPILFVLGNFVEMTLCWWTLCLWTLCEEDALWREQFVEVTLSWWTLWGGTLWWWTLCGGDTLWKWRFVGGRFVEGHFVEGRFVEGRFVEGHFVEVTLFW